MHKKLASDLTSLAHSILQMKNKEDVLALKEKAQEVYEKLALLAYVEEYVNTTPQATETKEELLEKIRVSEEILKSEKESIKQVNEETLPESNKEDEVVIEELEEEVSLPVMNVVDKVENEKEQSESSIKSNEVEEEDKQVVQEITEQPFDELEELLFSEEEEELFVEAPDTNKIKEHEPRTLEDELQDTLPVDVMADLFQKAEPKKTVNDLLQNTIKIDLNDRIAFVNHLFDGDQSDFNRVVSQLNTFKTEREAKSFINRMVKPDYDWSNKEEYETRFFEIIERRFA